MRARQLLLLTLVLSGIAVFVAPAVRGRVADSLSASRTSPVSPATDSAFGDSLVRAAEDLGVTVVTSDESNPAPESDPALAVRLLASRGGGTYIGEILAARDSMLFRWRNRSADPLRVWVQESGLEDVHAGFPQVVRDAFAPWIATGIPMQFSFVRDSAFADVHVTWVDRYESRTTGRTRWINDQRGWIVGAGIELALHQSDGRRLDTASLGAIARHEVGHLLGLDHCADERNIMAKRVRVTELSEADRATIRLVYALPPGSVRRSAR